ncbi:DUF2752 domain-containing protein [Streptomyces sp. NBRC 109706]|uniref:DUF2752 domain-containing protein n=1 Tax=Streptomyces sp. NBRC 109706 TaxID=1550035 RepID=UPI00082CF392|nr:DUF2752 domain-containing protein [Streptomyces sp. NBRC 109706]
MRQRLSRLGPPLAAVALLGAAVGYVARVDPGQPGNYTPCPLLTHLGLHCPGCGGLRATHALAHGDWASAFGHNALLVLAAVAVTLGLLDWTLRAVAGRPPRRPTPGRRAGWAAVVLVAVFTALRNLGPFSALRP